jgi:hypothetical protein
VNGDQEGEFDFDTGGNGFDDGLVDLHFNGNPDEDAH